MAVMVHYLGAILWGSTAIYLGIGYFVAKRRLEEFRDYEKLYQEELTFEERDSLNELDHLWRDITKLCGEKWGYRSIMFFFVILWPKIYDKTLMGR